jgi:hypothetical protein
MLVGESRSICRTMTVLLSTSHFVFLFIRPGTKWTCDAVYGCCFTDGSASSCPSGASAAVVPSASAVPHAQSYKNVTVSATDPRITYSPQWDLGTSTCDASQQSKKTVTANQSLSFNTQGVSGKSFCYLDHVGMTRTL